MKASAQAPACFATAMEKMSPTDDDARPAKRQRLDNAGNSIQTQSYLEVAYPARISSSLKEKIKQWSGGKLAESYAIIISGGPGDECEYGEITEDERDYSSLECCYGMVGLFLDSRRKTLFLLLSSQGPSNERRIPSSNLHC